MEIFNMQGLDLVSKIELIKLIIIIPVFLFWSIYDLLTKTVKVRWQKSLISLGIIYNFIYLFIDINQVNNNLTGFLVCYLVTYLYALMKRIFGLGDFGKGDIMYCAIVGLLFGTGVGIATIILSFILFDGIYELVKKLIPNYGGGAVAFFPFITAALLIIIFIIGQTRIDWLYSGMLGLVNIKSKYIPIF
jgi:prepilin signal peptidase PulO-like enzyme (type II secretory pathway)